VTNAVPQWSHDQAWSIWPVKLNRDFSAISNTLPQCGHFGRLKSWVASKFWVASIGIAELWHADWTIIVDPSSTLLPRIQQWRTLGVPYGAAATPS
jgi:hypothetical protein